MSVESNNDTDQNSLPKTHRSRRSRSSRHTRMKIWGLSFALLIMFVILFITSAYTSARINQLSIQVSSNQEQLLLKEKEINELKSQLTQSKDELEKLIKGRLPAVMKLVPDQVLTVNKDFIKNIVFTVLTQNDSKHYEYKLVVENLSHKIIVPKFRLLIFDKSGVQIGMDQVLRGEELAPGESRSFSSKIDFFMTEEPAYFQFSSMIPTGADRIQSLLK